MPGLPAARSEFNGSVRAPLCEGTPLSLFGFCSLTGKPKNETEAKLSLIHPQLRRRLPGGLQLPGAGAEGAALLGGRGDLDLPGEGESSRAASVETAGGGAKKCSPSLEISFGTQEGGHQNKSFLHNLVAFGVLLDFANYKPKGHGYFLSFS